MLSDTVNKRVRYGETDQMGYLYYGNYALYYEIGRVELLRALGITYKTIESEWGIIMPVMDMHTRYRRPARYDELITVKTQLKQVPERDVTFEMELFNETGDLINTGQVRLCFIRIADQQRVRCPAALIALIAPYFA